MKTAIYPRILDAFAPVFTEFEQNSQVRTNVIETPEAYVFSFEAPGFEKENFEIQFEKQVLHIQAKASAPTNVEQTQFLRTEFKVSPFKRSFKVQELINTAEIEAKYENGILKLTLPKEHKNDPKHIISIQ